MICADCHQECVRKGPLQARCGPCAAAHRAERARARSREWAAANPGRVKAIAAKVYKENKVRAIARATEWSAKNPERRREINRESGKRLRRADPAKFAAAKLARRNDAGVRLHESCSAAIRTSLKGGKGGASWERLVGYTVEQLKARLEPLFADEMSWANYGSWHIDHIKPVSLFTFEVATDREFAECWSLTNLQPLWAADNMRKGCKYDHSAPIAKQHLTKETPCAIKS